MITNNNIIQLIKIIKHEPTDLINLDQKMLLDSAKLHRVTGLIYRSLLGYRSTPPNLLNIFRESIRANQLRALLQLRYLSKINRLFLDNDIPMICIKGIILSYRLYGDIAVRASHDIDIFVSQKNIFLIDKLIRQLGFIANHCHHSFKPYNIHKILTVIKDIGYYHPQHKIRIEFHCQLISPYLPFYSFSQLWEKRQTIQLPDGSQFNILPPHIEWLYLCIHGSHHCFMRLQWLCDVIDYKQHFISASDFEQSYKQKNVPPHLARYYDLALFFMDLFNQRVLNSDQKHFYYRFSCLLMQRRKIDLSAVDNIMLWLLEYFFCISVSQKLKLISHSAKSEFVLLQTKVNIPDQCFFLYLVFYYIAVIPIKIFYRLANELIRVFFNGNQKVL